MNGSGFHFQRLKRKFRFMWTESWSKPRNISVKAEAFTCDEVFCTLWYCDYFFLQRMFTWRFKTELKQQVGEFTSRNEMSSNSHKGAIRSHGRSSRREALADNSCCLVSWQTSISLHMHALISSYSWPPHCTQFKKHAILLNSQHEAIQLVFWETLQWSQQYWSE